MARLLADASLLAGKEFKMGNFADIIEAIHVIQESMGITGTTAKEASDTINGSIASWKAALDNLLTGIGRNENIEKSRLGKQAFPPTFFHVFPGCFSIRPAVEHRQPVGDDLNSE